MAWHGAFSGDTSTSLAYSIARYNDQHGPRQTRSAVGLSVGRSNVATPSPLDFEMLILRCFSSRLVSFANSNERPST